MLKKTGLHALHAEQGALLVPFAGWEMPLHYGSQIDEHHQVRRDAGLFDVSHMAVIDIKGPDAQRYLQYLLANDVCKLTQPGRALYGCMLNFAGGVKDDLITYFISPTWYRLVVNAGTANTDLVWMEDQIKTFNISIYRQSSLSILAVQGPLTRVKASQALGGDWVETIASLEYFHFKQHGDWMIARTGYTGEDGIEIILPTEDAASCWKKLQAAGIQPIGLGARDTLRLEAGLNLYGQDMDESVTPLASGLTWTVALNNPDRHFIGREAIEQELKQGTKQELVGLVLTERGVLRHDQQVVNHDSVVGHITSGSFSPTLNRAIAFARVARSDETNYGITIRGKTVNAKKVKPPFVKKGHATFSM